MNCCNPTRAWICGTHICKDGVVSPRVVFSPNDAIAYFTAIGCLHLMDNNVIDMPCGKCVNCLMRKRKDMSVRLAHEASCHKDCCFITLTYNDHSVPVTDWRSFDDPDKLFDKGVGNLPELTLCPRDVQLFVKRLRRRLDYHYGVKVRYFAVGEYGTRTHRPHYHIIIFGWRPPAADLYRPLKSGSHLSYQSHLIEGLWTHGYSLVSDVNVAVAKYAARYVTKKYARIGKDDISCVVPEFTLQSTRHGGIGATWFDRYGADACRVGLCTLRSAPDRISKCTIPRYYWHRLRKTKLSLWLQLRDQRIEFVKSHYAPVAFDDVVNAAECVRYQLINESNKEIL